MPQNGIKTSIKQSLPGHSRDIAGSLMKVIRSGTLGFCMGVRRAIDMALRESVEKDCRVYSLGPLIHNPDVLQDLRNHGIQILKEEEIPSVPGDSTVIIRAHGISPAVEGELTRRGLRIIDATCPHVKANQNKARLLSSKGFHIFLAGEKEHGEIAGIRGYVEGPCSVVANPEAARVEAEKLAVKYPSKKTALIGQTTISHEEYRAIGEAIKRYYPALEIIDTICVETRRRQDALRELGGQVDAFIIAGGRESANTRRLLSIAENCGKKAWLVEKPEDLPPEIGDYKIVGLCSGASTPDKIIAEIEEELMVRSV